MQIYFLCVFIFLGCSYLFSLPEGEEVVHGEIRVVREPSKMQIEVSDKAILHFNTFDIAEGEKVRFVQPNKNSTVLSRVKSKNPSSLLGSLEANGKFFLVNPYGVYIGPKATIDTGAFLASTLDINDTDFLNGKSAFALDQKGEGYIINEGQICAEKFVALLAPRLENRGKIIAHTDQIFLKARKRFVLDFSGDKLLQFVVSEELEKQLQAEMKLGEEGVAPFSVDLVSRVLKMVVNDEGKENALSLETSEGKIRLLAASELKAPLISLEGEIVQVKGLIDASNEQVGEKGGVIQVLGEMIGLEEAHLKATGEREGGAIFVGGNFRGAGDLPQAEAVVVDEKTVFELDSLSQGNGGQAVIWSKGLTAFGGEISARGGAAGGNGGDIEISGKDLIYKGKVNLQAPYGQLGNLLFDPNDVVIGSSATTGSFTACPVSYSFISGTAVNQILNTDLQTQLASCNVTIDTTSISASSGSGPSGGSIRVSSAISWSAATTLNLVSSSIINVGAAITNSSSSTGFTALSLTSTGAHAASYYGINVVAPIQTTGGNIFFSGKGGNTNNCYGFANSGTGTVQTTNGNITFQNCIGGTGSSYCRGVSLSANVISTNGSIVFTNCRGGGSSGGVNNFGCIIGTVTVSAPTITGTFTGGLGSQGGSVGFVSFGGTLGGSSTTNLSITGVSQGTNASAALDAGIWITVGSLVQIGSGTLVLNGSTNSASGTFTNRSYGIAFNPNGGTPALNIGTGTATLTGSCGVTATSTLNHGIVFDGATLTASGGTITWTGTGGTGSGGSNYGVYFNPSSVTLSGTNTFNFTTCTGGAATGNTNVGVYFNKSLDAGTSGTINFRSVSGGGSVSSGTSSANYGVYIPATIVVRAGTIQSSTDGSRPYQIRGGLGLGGVNYGLYVLGTLGYTTANAANINLTATSAGFGSDNIGIVVGGSGIIRAGTTGSGTITLSGTASPSSTGASNGIYIAGSIISQGGNISLTGNGAAAGASYGIKIFPSVATITSSSGAISLTGTSTSSSTGSYGIDVSSVLSTASSSSLTLTGTGGSGSSSHGINIASTITNPGGIILNGTAGSGGSSFGVSIGANLTTSGGAITITGSSLLGASVTLDATNAGGTATGANINFSGSTSTINATAAGTQTLSLRAGSGGAVTLGGNIGNTTRLGGLTVTSAKTSSNAVNIGGNITTNALTISTSSPVTLTGSSIIDTSAANGTISFPSTINGTSAGSENLTLTAGTGAVTFSTAVGGVIRLGDLSVTSSNAAGVTIASNIISRSFQTASTTTTILSGSSNINTSGGAISFGGTVNGTLANTQALSLNAIGGAVTFSSTVGSTTSLASLSVVASGGINIGGNIVTGGIINLQNNATLTANATLNTTASATTGANISAAAISGPSLTLTLNAGTGGVIALSSDLNVGTFTLSNSSSTTISGATTAANITLTNTATNINFAGAINVSTSLITTANSYSLTFGNGGTITPATTFINTGLVTLAGGSSSLNFTNGLIHTAGSTAIQGAVTSGFDVSLAATNFNGVDNYLITSAGSITFNGGVIIGGNATLDTTNSGGSSVGANINFGGYLHGGSNLGQQGLALYAGTSTITLSADGDGATSLTSFAAYSPLSLGLSWDLDVSESSGSIIFRDTVNGASAGDQALTLTAGLGGINLEGEIGGTTRLGAFSLTSSDTSEIYIGSNITANSFTVVSAATTFLLGSSTIDTSIAGGGISFGGGIGGVSAGDQALTLTAGSGAITLAGAIGQLTRLGAISVTNSGAADVTIGSDITANSFTTANTTTVVLSNSSTIDTSEAGGTISFGGTINGTSAGAQALTLTAGSGGITLAGAVGGTRRLGAVSVTNSGASDVVIGSNITANSFTAASTTTAVLSSSSTIDTSAAGGSVSFGGTINATSAGSQALTLTAGSGAITLAGAVGGTTRLGAVSVTSSNASGVTIGSNITANSFIAASTTTTVLSGSSTINTSVAGGAISFGGTINGTSAGAQALTLTAGSGAITLAGATGGTTRLGAISVTSSNASGVTIGSNINASSFAATGTTTAVLSNSSTIDTSTAGGSISFGGTVNGTSAGSQALTLTAGSGAITLAGAVGGTTRLGAVSVTSSNASGVTIGSNITANSFIAASTTAAVLSGNSTIDTSAAGGAISFGGTINGTSAGAQALTLTAGSGAITLAGSIGGTTRLGAISLTNSGASDVVIGSNITANSFTTANTTTVVLSGSSTIDTSTAGGSISFGGTINATSAGSQALTLTAGSGAITLAGAVGGTTRLGAVSVTSSNASGVTIGGNITANSFTATSTTPALLLNNTTIDTSASGGSISFGGKLDGALAGSQSLTLNGGVIAFEGIVGTTSLNILNIASGTNSIFSANVTAKTINIHTPMTLVGSVILNATGP